MTTSKTGENQAIAGAILAFVYALLVFLATTPYRGLAPLGLAAFAVVAGAIGLVTILHAAMTRLAAEEKREEERLGDESAPLFAASAEALGVKARNLAQLEKFFVPGAALLLAGAELACGLVLHAKMGGGTEALAAKTPQIAALTAVGGIIFYLAGSYAAGIAFKGPQRVSRALGGELIGLAWLSGLVLLSTLLVRAGLPGADKLLTGVMVLLLVLRAVEKLANVVLDVYRPRGRGAGPARLAYESRVNGMLAQPKGILANLAEALNYQFGINLTEAWFKRALGVAAPAVLLFELLVLAAFSCFVAINPGEQAVRERWGRPYPKDNPVLAPGLHAKLPWPIDKVYRVKTSALRRLQVALAHPPAESHEESNALLWTDDVSAHLELFLAPHPAKANAARGADKAAAGASSYGLVTASTVVHYRVTDVRQHLYNGLDAHHLLETLTTRELAQYIAAHDLTDLLRGERGKVGAVIRERLESEAQRLGLGVEIAHVGIERLQPPGAVAGAFQAITASQEQRLESLWTARQDASQAIGQASAEAHSTRASAHGDKARDTSMALAERDNFDALHSLYLANPRLFKLNLYLDALESALTNKKKIVVVTDVHEQTIYVDLKEKIGAGLLELTP